MPDALPKSEGLREKKRRQTLQRIAEVGLELFLAKGYEATTLDEIAESAGISRRTFFHYFESKDDILLAYVSGYAEALNTSVVENSSARAPLDIACDALLKVSARSPASQTIAIARLMRDSKVFRIRRHAGFLQLEEALYEGLRELWPAKERRDGLQLVAMASICALRLATETWVQQDGKRPLPKYIQEAFKKLKAEI
jgi:AcrR family transcriptional regulator